MVIMDLKVNNFFIKMINRHANIFGQSQNRIFKLQEIKKKNYSKLSKTCLNSIDRTRKH
jgi:hypothetical protein